MTRRPEDTIEKQLCHLFPSSWLDAQAREVGMVQRQRKVDPVSLFWTLLLSFGIGDKRDIAGLRRAYEEATGTLLAASSFYDRFTPSLVAFLSQACDRALQPMCEKHGHDRGALSAFRDVLISDATVLRLHDTLQKTYRACRTNHTQAAAKLHLVLSVLGTSDHQVRLTSERTADVQVLTVGAWVQSRLLLFDLGYFKYALLDRIDREKGFFVSRLKDGCAPLLVDLYRGSDHDLIGHTLPSVLSRIRRDVLDAQVEITFPKRRYRGKQTRVRRRFRLVGIKDPQTRQYHLYLTNLDPQRFSAEAIAQLYAARWLVELIFKQLKSFYQLEGFPTTNPHILHALIYAAILTMIVSRHIEQVLQQRPTYSPSKNRRHPQNREGTEWLFPFLRLAAVLADLSARLLQDVLRQAGKKPRPIKLTQLLWHEARDPNRTRDSLTKKTQRIPLNAP